MKAEATLAFNQCPQEALPNFEAPITHSKRTHWTRGTMEWMTWQRALLFLQNVGMNPPILPPNAERSPNVSLTLGQMDAIWLVHHTFSLNIHLANRMNCSVFYKKNQGFNSEEDFVKTAWWAYLRGMLMTTTQLENSRFQFEDCAPFRVFLFSRSTVEQTSVWLFLSFKFGCVAFPIWEASLLELQ